ncbi:MAG TPA: DUF262 domain-containing protein [Thermomicrobiales bacterium]|jgi:hypothetical protein
MTAATLVERDATEHAGVIIDTVDDDGPLQIPANHRRIKTDKQDIPVETLHGWIRRGKLTLQPEFQRNFVWNGTKASRLVESLLLDILCWPFTPSAVKPGHSCGGIARKSGRME